MNPYCEQENYLTWKVQAEKIKQISQQKFTDIQIGVSVTVPIWSLNRHKGNACNILGLVMERTADVFYKSGTKQGLISSLYAMGQIQSCKGEFQKLEDVPERDLSLRVISGHSSAFAGQVFQKCSCTKKYIT